MPSLVKRLLAVLFPQDPVPVEMRPEHRAFLLDRVAFYQALSVEEQVKFEQRCLSFIDATDIVGHDTEVSDEDCLLVASGAVILAWGFSQWHYVKVDTVILVSKAFNELAEFGQPDSNITGLVGTHHLRGTMILSQPALHQGFINSNDKRNVAIHEFAHLIDIADGDVDGLPKEIADNAFCLPWLQLIDRKIGQIDTKRSDIRDYGATNRAEFFAVASEYFFERPKLLKRRHPQLYSALQRFYKQNRADVQSVVRIRKKAPCPCGSGKRYKRCCMPS